VQAVERRIESVDSSRTEITPTDGTKLVAPRAQRLAEARPADAASYSIGMAARSRAPASLDWRECS